MPTTHPRPWRRGSLFGPGPRRPLDRELRARFRFLLRAHTRARRLSAKGELVGQALLKRLGEDGQCDPSHGTIAADTGVSPRTVRRATAAMCALGLLRWQTRLVRTDDWRAEQTSNAYELVPAAGPHPPACGGHNGRQTLKKILSGVTRAIAAPPEASDEWGRWNAERQLALLTAAQSGS